MLRPTLAGEGLQVGIDEDASVGEEHDGELVGIELALFEQFLPVFGGDIEPAVGNMVAERKLRTRVVTERPAMADDAKTFEGGR